MSQIIIPKIFPKEFLKHALFVMIAGSYYKKVLATGRYFPEHPIFKKEVTLLVNIDEQKNRNRKYASLFINYLQTTFLKGKQPLKYNAVPWQSEAIAKRIHYKVITLLGDVAFLYL